MPPNEPLVVQVDRTQVDEWVSDIRLLLSRIGFALDAYLADDHADEPLPRP
jgi:hypothetical protein